MPAPELIQRFVLPLESLGLPYMVTGSVAAMAYGEPRLTNDVDVVIALARRDVTRFRLRQHLDTEVRDGAEVLLVVRTH